ncbi:MAG: hypothetical protein ACTSYA_10410 [Candidatus Kariarchaeaceae archaeon]
MSQASKEAFLDESNKSRREGHKQKILKAYESGRPMSIRIAAKETGLTYSQTQKWVNDLIKEDRLRVYGTQKEGRNSNTLYELNPNPSLFKKPTRTNLLIEVVRSMAPDVAESIICEFKERCKVLKGGDYA